MYAVLAILLLGVAAAFHAGALLGGRRAVTVMAGPRMGARSLGLAAARALAGVAGWYLAASVMLTSGLAAGGEVFVDETSMRVHVGTAGPASRAGVLDGDRIVTAGGVPIQSWNDLKSVVGKHGTEPIALEIDRGGQAITVIATPEGAPAKLMVGPWTESRSVGLGHAMSEGLIGPGKMVVNTLHALLRVFTGSERTEVSGPVAIVRETSSSMRASTASSIRLAGTLGAYFLIHIAAASVLYELLARRR